MEAIKRFRVVIMVGVLAALGGIVWWAMTSKSGETPEEEDANAPELPEIDQGDITQIEIRRPEDDAPTRLVRDGDSWRLAAPVEAPAARPHVDTLLEKLGGLELAGVAAHHRRQHERLEVDEEHGVHVIAKVGNREVIDMWVGGFRGGNTMVRLDGQEEVLEVRGSIKFAFNRAANDWRDRAVADVDPNTVREATFVNTNGTFRFTKNGAAWEQVRTPLEEGGEELPAIENFDASKVQSAVNMLARLRATDFAAADVTRESAGLGETAARVTFVSGEGDAAQTTVLLAGNEVAEGARYVMREGSDTIFTVSRAMAERLVPTATTFQQSDEPEPEGEGAPPGMPPGMPPGGGGGQIPPELMEQIQRQLQQQGAGGGGHP